MKLRIVKYSTPVKYSFHVEKKFLCWWGPISFSDGDYSDIASFKTLEEAEEFIAGGCKDPAKPVMEIIKYIELPNG